MLSMGIAPTEGDCRYCSTHFQITYLGTPIVAGECTRCYMDRSRGPSYVERMARSAARRAKAHKVTGDLPKVRETVKEAKRFVAILKAMPHG